MTLKTKQQGPDADNVLQLSYMRNTITIRADEALRRALDARAAAEDKSVSELVREILADALQERTMGSRVGHLSGRVELGRTDLKQPGKDIWREQMRSRNWRP